MLTALRDDGLVAISHHLPLRALWRLARVNKDTRRRLAAEFNARTQVVDTARAVEDLLFTVQCMPAYRTARYTGDATPMFIHTFPNRLLLSYSNNPEETGRWILDAHITQGTPHFRAEFHRTPAYVFGRRVLSWNGRTVSVVMDSDTTGELVTRGFQYQHGLVDALVDADYLMQHTPH